MGLVSVQQQKDFRVTAGVRNHKFTLDLPAEQGGMDAGPTPVELFVAALGTCMAMHIVKYCKGAKLPHEGLGIDLDFQIVKNPLRVGSIMADITLPPDFPADRIEAVKRAAQQCTVKNTLKESTALDVEAMAGVA